ncbi:hypothetical protein MMC07_004986 [Pseudocyphellaria aurata]|nr:hypothetical protein [Pseudocyphellaria aurata]
MSTTQRYLVGLGRHSSITHAKAARSRNMSASISSDGGPVYFWREYFEKHAFLSQWYPASFTAPSPGPNSTPMIFLTAEQYMMYHKGVLFGDVATAEKILAAKTPMKQKALGREVKGFDVQRWNEHRERIVENGNWHKFVHPTGESHLKRWLLQTGARELVEASPYDRIWGIGYCSKSAESNRAHWGENLLGKVLMRVRERVRKEEPDSYMVVRSTGGGAHHAAHVWGIEGSGRAGN